MKCMKSKTKIVAELLAFFASHGQRTSTAIANASGLGQPQIHRNLFGKPKRVTKTHRELCIYAKISLELELPDPRTSDVLMDSLANVWDGSEEHARRLAELLFAHRRACM